VRSGEVPGVVVAAELLLAELLLPARVISGDPSCSGRPKAAQATAPSSHATCVITNRKQKA
jgi:hypothetical protein